MITMTDKLKVLAYIIENVDNYYYFDCINDELKDDPKNIATMPKLSDKLLKYLRIRDEHLNRPDYPVYVFSSFVMALLLFIIENKFYKVNNIAIYCFTRHLKSIDESIDICKFRKIIKSIDTYFSDYLALY